MRADRHLPPGILKATHKYSSLKTKINTPSDKFFVFFSSGGKHAHLHFRHASSLHPPRDRRAHHGAQPARSAGGGAQHVLMRQPPGSAAVVRDTRHGSGAHAYLLAAVQFRRGAHANHASTELL
jgi:hypothetical protein